MRKVTPIEDRFWAKVSKDPSGCWLWVGGCNKKGYGKLPSGVGGWILAHRFSYELHIGKFDDAQCVLHKCDTPGCVKPDHLFLGTRADNAADKVAKGRQAYIRGELSGMAVLSESDVRAIRADTRMQKLIAADYGVRSHTISRIKARVRWAHVA